MTELEHNEDIEFVSARLRSAKQRVKLAEACVGVLVLAAYTLMALTAVVIADHVRAGGLSAETRLIVRRCYLVSTIGLLTWLAIVPVVRRINDLFAARAIEQCHPEFKNSLISALQLAWRRELPGSMRTALAARAADDLVGTSPWRAVDKRSVRRAGIATAGAVAVFLVYAALAPKPVVPSIRRALGVELPPPTRTQIVIEQPPADFETLIDSPVRMVARITGRRPDDAFVRFSQDGGKTWLPDHRLSLAPPPTVQAVDPRERRRWRAVKSGRDVQHSMHYQFVADDARSEIRLLRVRLYPAVAEVGVHCEYPAYTGLAPTDHEGGDVTAVVGTRVTVSLRTTVPAEVPPMLVFGKSDRGRLRTQATDKSGARFAGRFRVEADDEYTIDYRDRRGVRNRDPIAYVVKSLPDQPPQIELERPPDDVALFATDSMRLICRASDDFGLADAMLGFQIGQDTGRVPLGGSQPAGVRAVHIERTIPLSRLGARPGRRITWWVTVRDNRRSVRGGPAFQSTQSEKRHIRVKDQAEPTTAGRGPTTTRGGQDATPGPVSQPVLPAGSRTGRTTSQPASDRGTAPKEAEAGTDFEGAPRSRPAEDLEQFVETHRRELEVLKRRLAGEPADSDDRREAGGTSAGEEQAAPGTAEPADGRADPKAVAHDDRDEPNLVRQEGGDQSDQRVGPQTAQGGQKQAGRGDPSAEEGQVERGRQGQQSGQGERGGQAEQSGRNEQAGPRSESAQSQQGGQAERSGQGNQAGRSEQGSQGAQSGQDEQGGQGERSGQGEQVGQGEQGGQGERSGQGEQVGQGEQSGRGAQSGQGEQGGQGERSGQGEQVGQGEQSGQGAQSGQGEQGGQGEQEGQAGQGGQGQQGGEGKGSGQSAVGGEEGSSGEGSASPGAGSGGGARDLSGSSAPTPELPTTRPQLDDAQGLAEQSGAGQAPPPSVDRAEQLINELDRQLRKGQADPNLLKALDWTPEQARGFVRAFRRLDRGASTSRPGSTEPQRVVRTKTRQPGDDRWRSARGRDRRVRGATIVDHRDSDEISRLLEVRRQQVGEAYRERLEAYYKTVATFEPVRPATQPANPAP